ncbi:MAG: transporter substrate-binding domain-containing protein [Oscillospiraceae bacterium]
MGIDAEIAQKIGEKLGHELVIDNMEFGSIITGVTAGKADFSMAGMTMTEDRLKNVDFSDPYANGVQVVIVREDAEITSAHEFPLADGATYVAGVQQNTTGDVYATDELGDDRVQRYNKGADTVLALNRARSTASSSISTPPRSLSPPTKA